MSQPSKPSFGLSPRKLALLQAALEKESLVPPGQRAVAEGLITEAERHQLLVEWNNTRTGYPRDSCIHELFEVQAGRTPDAVAVVFEDRHWTYAELNRHANKLARHLRSLGVGRETLVGICAERCLELAAGLLAILKAGGAYVPLDPAHPPEWLAFILQDASVSVLVTQTHLQQSLPRPVAQTVLLESFWESYRKDGTSNPSRGAGPGNLAYVIYTSGSTGNPKGVMIEHRSLSNQIEWMRTAFRFTERDRVLQKTTLSFDGSVWEFFVPLLSGACVVMSNPATSQDPALLIEEVRNYGITVIELVPSLLALLLEQGELEGCASLRLVFCGGETLSREVQDKFFQSSRAELCNTYGPTEACMNATWHLCLRGDRRDFVPIGRPVANAQIYILDHRLQPVPIGVTGELHVGGESLARGYLNLPELTAVKFVPDPFSDKPGARFFKTGDLGRYLPDGSIEFLGRVDEQVKIRGFRVELGGIEAVLRRHAGIRDVAVLAHEDQPGEIRMVAYVVPAASASLTIEDLRSLLRRKLPEYMMPSAFVLLDRLPLLPSGKLNRRALLQAGGGRLGPSEAVVAPRTPIEDAVARVWKEVLGLETISIYGNFFELGGHSLLAVRAASRLRAELGVELSVRELFEHPTVAELALAAGKMRAEKAEQQDAGRMLAGIEGAE